MTIEELHDLLPEELRVRAELIPPDVAQGISYLAHCNELRDAGTPEAEVPDFETWKAPRHANQ